MSNAWPQVPLGQCFHKNQEWVALDPTKEYREVTVRLWGKGVVLRGVTPGSEIAADRRIVVRAGQFILSRIDARNGASGVVPASLDGAIVSSDFPSFTVRHDRLMPEFLGWLAKTQPFVDMCRAASEGTTNRVRLKEEKFLASAVPVPPVAEQRRIVARLDALAAKIEEAKGMHARAVAETALARAAILKECFRTKQDGRVGDHISVQSGYAFKSEWFTAEGVRLARNVNVGHGMLHWTESARIPESRRSEFANFDLNDGDILVSLDRPIISTGVKVARVRPCDLPALLLQRVGRARFKDSQVNPDFFFGWLCSPWFTSAIDPGRSNGVPHIAPGDIERIAFSPPPYDDQLAAVRRAAELMESLKVAAHLQGNVGGAIAVIMPAALKRAFAGSL